MIAEEYGKWSKSFALCATKRDLDMLLGKIAESQKVAIRLGEESYSEIGRKLALDRNSDLGYQFQAAINRLGRRRHD